MPRRILLLVTDLEIGGTPTVVRELATRLNDPRRIVVEVACLKRWGPVADQLRAAGITVTALGASRAWQLPKVVQKLRELVRDHAIDTVLSFLIHANAVAAAAARDLPGVTFLQSIQTVQPRPRWHWWLQRVVQSSAAKVVVPSSAVARVAADACDVPPGRIAVIPNAVDPDDFPRVDVFRGPPLRVGFLGRLDPVKQLSLFFESVKWAAGGDLAAEGHIFGEGPERANLERWAADDRRPGKIVLHGAVARPQDALRHMDVLYLSSIVEGFGLVLIEAMASGVPVVARAGGGATDVVEHGVNGILIDDPNTEYRWLQPALYRLRDDARFRERLIEGGLRTVRERFSWDVVLPQYCRLLNV